MDTMTRQHNIKYESRRTVVYDDANDDVNDAEGGKNQHKTDIMWKDSNGA